MNWYRFSQQWSSFTPRQRDLPFMYSPGLSGKAENYLNRDMMIPEEAEEIENFNLYHVTTNLAGVLRSGKLLSRREIGNVGLGGGIENEASNLISTTYDYNRALDIYHSIKFVCEIVNGRIPASQIWDEIGGRAYDIWENGDIQNVISEYVPADIVKEIYDGEKDIKEIDKFIKTPQQIYRFMQLLESFISKDEEMSDETYESAVIGFTGDFESMKKINPSQVAILQLAARKGAWSDHLAREKEIRFYPQDLFVVRVSQP